jgi:hypothetical protein
VSKVKITIRKSDAEILVDGERVRGVTGISITARPSGLPTVTLEFQPIALHTEFEEATVEREGG